MCGFLWKSGRGEPDTKEAMFSTLVFSIMSVCWAQGRRNRQESRAPDLPLISYLGRKTSFRGEASWLPGKLSAHFSACNHSPPLSTPPPSLPTLPNPSPPLPTALHSPHPSSLLHCSTSCCPEASTSDPDFDREATSSPCSPLPQGCLDRKGET